MLLQHYGVPTAPLVVLHLDDEEELTPEKIQKTMDHYQHAKKVPQNIRYLQIHLLRALQRG